MARTPAKPPTRRQRLARWARSEAGAKWSHRAPAIVIASIAAYVSYGHQVALCVRSGQEEWVSSHATPLSVDALVIVSARYITRSKTLAGKVIAWAGFLVGTAATLAANVMSAQPTTLGRAVAGWPAVAIIITAAMLHWGEMKAKVKRAPTPVAKRTAKRATPVKAPVTVKALPVYMNGGILLPGPVNGKAPALTSG